ncbi:aldehyde dehydrogenase family protein [Aneurinibacillus sp. UBA3580]|uniref:aldehyde dehydrogenase family protein n=1 Tax=Aneurinibacillus sp. UBA3580 TaxID=1946041 RepID=UPI00257AD551|nr:aldehyde dehydrogenase family protein [Aneurinibacillus sp. UBA3580]
MSQNNFRMYMNGKWVEGKGNRRTLIDPSTGSALAEVAEASLEQVHEAVLAAKIAFETTEWPVNAKLRVALLYKLADLLEASAEEFAQVESRNTGKPIRESRLDIMDSVTCIRYYANLVESRDVWQKEMEDGTTSRIHEEPIGVCALIVPWNFPLLLGIWKLAPALAAGNTIVFKPSEITPLSFIKLAALIEEAGMPDGVFNLVLGDGAAVGQPLVSHESVNKVSFTGGAETGRRIYQECAKTLKRVSLELGGKSPLIIFEDADVEIAVDWALFGAFFNQGQVCVASSRILVHNELEQEFLKRLSDRLAHIRIGKPLEEATEMGPVISLDHLKKIEQYIQIGISEGATLFTGGTRIQGEDGYYITPAVFTDVNQEMRIVQEEIFGPVITVQSFHDEEEAIALANGTKYGLAAGILSQDIERANRVANRVQAGTIWINGYHTPHVETAWGGFKQSGIGRELGPYGLAAFTEPKHINMNSQLQKVSWYSAT